MLSHHHCNSVYVPRQSKGKCRTLTMRNKIGTSSLFLYPQLCRIVMASSGGYLPPSIAGVIGGNIGSDIHRSRVPVSSHRATRKPGTSAEQNRRWVCPWDTRRHIPRAKVAVRGAPPSCSPLTLCDCHCKVQWVMLVRSHMQPWLAPFHFSCRVHELTNSCHYPHVQSRSVLGKGP